KARAFGVQSIAAGGCHMRRPTLVAGAVGLLAAALASTAITPTRADKQEPRETPAVAPRLMEELGRGVVAVNEGDGKVFVGWRLLGTDPEDIAFNLYRATGDAAPVKLNKDPHTKSTNYADTGVDLTRANAYFVRPVLNGKEQE